MKKLFIILSLVAIALIACTPSQGQIATLNMAPDQTYIEYSSDVTLTDATAKYFQINTQAPWYTAQAYIVQLDSATGNHTNVACVLAGRVSDQTTTWTTISTTNWTGVTKDTVMIVLNATENQYRQFKLTLTGTGTGTTKIDNFEFKLYYGLP